MWLHRFSIFVALVALIAVILGVLVAGALPSSDAAAVKPRADADVIARDHRISGEALTVLILILAAWITIKDSRKGLRIFSWIVFVLVLVEGSLGLTSGSASISHALLAQVVFALISAIVVTSSSKWKKGPEYVKDSGWPSMRSLAVMTTTLVFIQVILGASFRYGAVGLLWHIAGAILVALMNLFIGVCAIQQYPKHTSLRPAAIAMLVITSVQVFLGMVVISIGGSRILQNSPAALVSAVLHVMTGALTLASTLVLAIQVRRNVQPKGSAVLA